MEIPEIILKKIDNEIKSGNKNRNIILRKVISESKDLTTILNYCKNNIGFIYIFILDKQNSDFVFSYVLRYCYRSKNKYKQSKKRNQNNK